jgi:hypothetical protein
MLLTAFMLSLSAAAPTAGPTVTLVVGAEATPAERFAADWLSQRLKVIYAAEVSVAAMPPDDAKTVIYLGTAASNPMMVKVAGPQWPTKLGPRGHLLRSVPGGLVLGGGSPRAVIWAVSEYLHSLGARSLLHGDFAPLEPPLFVLDKFDQMLDPTEQREWVLDLRLAWGPSAWSIAELTPLLGQLVKLKFERLLVIPAGDPQNPARPIGPIKVDGDTPGRGAFGGQTAFMNADFRIRRADVGKVWLERLLAAAKSHGLSVALAVPPPQADAFQKAYPHVDQVVPGLYPPRAWGVLPGSGLGGVSVAASLPGDADAWANAAWAKTDPLAEDALTDLYAPIFNASTAERMVLVTKAAAEGNAALAKVIVLAQPLEKRLELWGTVAEPELLKAATAAYGSMYAESLRGFNRAAQVGRDTLFYHSRRAEFALGYLGAVTAYRASATAKAKGDADAAVEEHDKAIESLYNAMSAYGGAARDPSDRAVLALVAEHLYRPLTAQE